ncbi:MAG TPA: hypothetical protein ENO20_08185 [Bacteroides sp.]|nr:hypothetical protein [Bacteroides sp.]
MKKEEIERLRFRKQYLLSPRPVRCPFLYSEYQVTDRYRLYAHPDLKVNELQKNGTRLFLLGDLFDYRSPEKLNAEILQDLSTLGFREILQEIGEYCGRFVLIHAQGDALKLVHDATAARKIYYCRQEEGDWFSSRPQLLANVLNIEKTDDPELLDYYRSDVFVEKDCAGIGDFTIYKGIRQVMPNHYYDVQGSAVHRYWPEGKNGANKPEEAACRCAAMVKGFMESITRRYEVMLPVTGGKDSRTLLAATRHMTDRVFCYVNKMKHLDAPSFDIATPEKLCREHHIDFHVLDPYIPIDEDFERIYFENNEFASRKYLPLIYNYYVNFRDRVNLPGNTATAGCEWFRATKMHITGKRLAKRNRVDRWQFAVEYYDQWIREIREHAPDTNMKLYDLFYWEERMGNWGGQTTMDKDIAQEDINPFNSRNLVMLYLSVPPKYLEIPFFKFYLEVIRHLWPELLHLPVKSRCIKNTIFQVMKTVGVLNFYFKIRYSYF